MFFRVGRDVTHRRAVPSWTATTCGRPDAAMPVVSPGGPLPDVDGAPFMLGPSRSLTRKRACKAQICVWCRATRQTNERQKDPASIIIIV